MKKYILLSFLALWMCTSINAQPYKIFRPFVDYLYSDSKSFYHGFRIIKTDSLENGDSVLIPVQEKLMFFKDCTRFYASWISYQIIQKPDGTDILFNQNYDSIIIKTLGVLNESWDCFRYKNGSRIEAKIIAWEINSFLGISDSTKTISFSYYDSTNKRIPNRIDSLQIVLSKNYGLIKTLNFMYFPDILSYNLPMIQEYAMNGFGNNLGIQNITSKDIYNFQPGDLMDILFTKVYQDPYHSFFDTTKIKQEILSRIDSGNNISYEIREITFQILSQDNQTSRKHTDTIKWLSYPKNFTFSFLESLSGLSIAFYYNPTIFSIYSTTLNSFNVNHLQKNTLYSGSMTCQKYNPKDSCYGCVYLDSANIQPYLLKYIERLGGPYYQYRNANSQDEEKKLVYYKKGAETWGVPLSVKDNQIQIQNPFFLIYPNPWDKTSTLTFKTLTKGKIQIISQLGRIVYENDISAGQNTLTLSKDNFVTGLYFIKLLLQNGIQSTKVFIVQ